MPTPSTAMAISTDSGEHWSAEGAWRTAPGVLRIPLPLPLDGLRAVNVYVLEGDDGLTLIDGGWAIEAARDVFERSLRSAGYGFSDIRQFLVTHSHRDHYTLAAILGEEYGAEVGLGAEERTSLELFNEPDFVPRADLARALASAGAAELAERWADFQLDAMDRRQWRLPDRWLEDDSLVELGSRTLRAVHTPGHTPGHYVFADASAGLLFSGDHVLPTITPSIGFTEPPPPNPLQDFLASLTKVRTLPDLQVLPAHGPVSPSSYQRVDELLAHHEVRLELSLRALGSMGISAFDVAQQLPWTRHERRFDELDTFNQGLAVLESRAHLEVLVARGQASSDTTGAHVSYRVTQQVGDSA